MKSFRGLRRFIVWKRIRNNAGNERIQMDAGTVHAIEIGQYSLDSKSARIFDNYSKKIGDSRRRRLYFLA